MTITGVVAAKTAVTFGNATSCGWVRGRIAGASDAVVVSFAAGAVSCYVEGADLSGIGTDSATASKISASPGAGYRLTVNYGSTQRTPVGFGAPVPASIAGTGTATSITVVSSNTVVPITASITLYTINGGVEGDLLTLTKSGTGTLTVFDSTGATGNVKLSSACLLSNPDSSLTLLRKGSNWVQIAQSDNG